MSIGDTPIQPVMGRDDYGQKTIKIPGETYRMALIRSIAGSLSASQTLIDRLDIAGEEKTLSDYARTSINLADAIIGRLDAEAKEKGDATA